MFMQWLCGILGTLLSIQFEEDKSGILEEDRESVFIECLLCARL